MCRFLVACKGIALYACEERWNEINGTQTEETTEAAYAWQKRGGDRGTANTLTPQLEKLQYLWTVKTFIERDPYFTSLPWDWETGLTRGRRLSCIEDIVRHMRRFVSAEILILMIQHCRPLVEVRK